MYYCLLDIQPYSVNNRNDRKKQKYKFLIDRALNRFNQNIIQFENTEELYGVVYYFHRNRTDLDADNISKPVWDCLQSILFSNDLQVKLRMAGVVDISYGKYWELSETLYETGLNEEFEHFFENRNHIVYIECGRLKPDMFQFNLEEQNAN